MCQSRNRSKQRQTQGLTMIRISKTHHRQGSLPGQHAVRRSQTHQRQLQAGHRVTQACETSRMGAPWTPQHRRPECVADCHQQAPPVPTAAS